MAPKKQKKAPKQMQAQEQEQQDQSMPETTEQAANPAEEKLHPSIEGHQDADAQQDSKTKDSKLPGKFKL